MSSSKRDAKLVKFNVWTKLRFASADAQQMLPRFGHSAASFGTKLLLFGGNNAQQDQSDSWEYNLGQLVVVVLVVVVVFVVVVVVARR